MKRVFLRNLALGACKHFFIFLLSAWVDTMWDLEFTEFEPLDPRIAEDITADGLDSFTSLYSALAPFAAGEQESREVT